jgi:hypothetical protein
MLTPMDIPGAAASGTTTVPWLLLAVLLGAGLVLLTGPVTALLLRRRRRGNRPGPAAAGYGEDDLPGFLESPPGSAATTPAAATGWAALTAPPVAVPAPRARRDALVVLTALSGAALLLLGVATAVLATSGPEGRPGHARPADASAGPAADGAAARLTFGGLVLEPRAVGVTATYPVVEIATDGGSARAQVELPTFNCLTGEAPADPAAAGCTRSLTEYATLTSPELVVRRDGDGLLVTGRFPTEVRPNGGAPVPTGRAYELRITVAPVDGGPERGWRPAEGVLELGSVRVGTVDEPGVSVLRSGS